MRKQRRARAIWVNLAVGALLAGATTAVIIKHHRGHKTAVTSHS